MLSATNEINDIKSELGSDYSYFGYTDDAAFVVALTQAVDRAMYSLILPNAGRIIYDQIVALDGSGLDDNQTYIYKAEIDIAINNFYTKLAETEKYAHSGKTFTTDGYSQDGALSTSGKESIAQNYYNSGVKYLANAGYTV